MKKVLLALLCIAGLQGVAGAVGLSGYLVNETGLAHDATYSTDLQADGVTAVSAQAVYSSATFSAKTFTDGQISTGSINLPTTVSRLSSATATNQITVVTNSTLAGAVITVPGFVLKEGISWKKGSTAAISATRLAAALTNLAGIPSSAAGSIVYSTAPSYGTFYNTMAMRSSTQTTLSVAHPTFVGGQDNAVISVNGTGFRAGLDFQVGATSATAATSLATAINASVQAPFVTATANSPTNGLVAIVSDKVGTLYNFSVAASTTAVAFTNPTLVGGANASWTINTPTITVTNHGFTTGLAVVYTTGTVVIGGLTNNTQYFVGKLTANTFALATSKVNALAGTYITLTSSATPTSAHTYTLTPSAITGTPGFKWQVSNDNSTWLDLNVSSVTMSSYTTPPSSTAWDFGPIGMRYLRANVTGPTTGGIFLQIAVQGSNPF